MRPVKQAEALQSATEKNSRCEVDAAQQVTECSKMTNLQNQGLRVCCRLGSMWMSLFRNTELSGSSRPAPACLRQMGLGGTGRTLGTSSGTGGPCVSRHPVGLQECLVAH
jgi:hypothetical protein